MDDKSKFYTEVGALQLAPRVMYEFAPDPGNLSYGDLLDILFKAHPMPNNGTWQAIKISLGEESVGLLPEHLRLHFKRKD